jgi:2-phosphosulfolactate phosphatase
VFDVLRATTSMVTALANGAQGIIPVTSISAALGWRRRRPQALLAGERHGLLIGSDQTGGRPFDLGNSPREFINVSDRMIIMTTTNGTLALQACQGAHKVFVCSMLNLSATAEAVLRAKPAHLLLVCGGTYDQVAAEDVLAAGAFCDEVWQAVEPDACSDSACLARRLYRMEKGNLARAFGKSRNGRRLRSSLKLRADVAWSARRDVFPLVAMLGKDGVVRRV